MNVFDALKQRRSIKAFDPGHSMDGKLITRLFEAAALAPSSFNLQHWRMVAVTDKEIKARLCAASWNQTQVAEASLVVVICGDPEAHLQADYCWRDAPEAVREKMIPLIHGFYSNNLQLQRDEAVRSGSLIGMALMLAAVEMGYDSCPMIGFDPAKVAEIIQMPKKYLPVMLLPIGKKARDARPKPGPMPLKDVVKLQSFAGPGL